MPIITEVQFAHEDGALADTLARLPDVEVRVVRETSTDPRTRHYFIRIANEERERIEAALDDDHTVLDATRAPTFDRENVWAIQFHPDTKLLAPRVTDSGGLVVDARGSGSGRGFDGWHERWLLPDPEAIHDIWQHARAEGFSFELLEFHRSGHTDIGHVGRDALTDQQLEAMATAYERGYFTEPRETSLEALGDELDLSASAVGGRLKRGMRSLIGATLVVDRSVDYVGAIGNGRGVAAIEEDHCVDAHEGARSSSHTGTLAAVFAGGERAQNPSRGPVISLEVYVEHPDLALAPTIRRLPAIDIGVVSDAGTDPDHDVYFFWVEAEEYATVEAAFDDDPTVATYDTIIETGERRTYAIEYTEDARLITPAITEMGVLVRESRSHESGWLLALHVQDHATLNRFNEYLDRSEFHFEVFELRQGESSIDGPAFGLTDSQTEALVCAYDHGYYDDPREISLEELGAILGLSQTAVSGRLRRGSSRMIAGVLDV